jgi:hypothetical protein
MAITASKPAINIREKLAELDFDKVPFQKMPAGSVLQVVQGTVKTVAYSTTSTDYAEVSEDFRTTLSPKKAGNKIVISFNCQIGLADGVHQGLKFFRSVDGGGTWAEATTSTAANETHRNSTGGYMLTTKTVTWVDEAVSEAPHTYTVYFNRGAGAGTGLVTCRINDNGMGSFLLLTEVAQ